MVPASDPKLVVAVMVDEPQGSIYGGSVAAPAFQKIVGWAVPALRHLAALTAPGIAPLVLRRCRAASAALLPGCHQRHNLQEPSQVM